MIYRSREEELFAKKLEERNIEFNYEPFKLPYPVVLTRRYLPDFVFDKAKIIIEFKGWFTGADRKKLIAVKKEHPDWDIRIVFQRDNWLTKKHAMRYSEWAEKHGFKYFIGTDVPKEWIKELRG